MKKLFIFALAGLALASCSDDEENVVSKNGAKKDASVLSFSTYTAGATRAADVTSADVKTNGFKVAALYDNALYFEAGETAKVNATTTDGIADTQTDTYYWPSFSAGNIGFRAFNLSSGAAWTATKEYESIDFTVASTAADQKDLVVAYAEATSKPTDGVQPLNFTHALSKVNFSFKGAKATNRYTINKVEVIAAGGDATMEFAETTELGSTNGTNDTDQPNVNSQAKKVNWTYTAIDGDNALVSDDSSDPAQGVLYTYYNSADSTVKTGTVVTGETASAMNANFMFLPQTGKIAVRVYYKVEDATKLIGNCGYSKTDAKGRHEGDANYEAGLDTDAPASIYGCKTVVIDLDGTMAPAWEAGKAYRFTMTLPDDNFIGDKNGDGNADGKDKDTDADLDGDADDADSEFDILTPIRFSVTVSAWETVENNSNITIK